MRAISRFFVSVTDDTGAIDPMGVDAANLESAIDQAVSLARQLRETGEENGDDRSNWTLGIGSDVRRSPLGNDPGRNLRRPRGLSLLSGQGTTAKS